MSSEICVGIDGIISQGTLLTMLLNNLTCHLPLLKSSEVEHSVLAHGFLNGSTMLMCGMLVFTC